MVCTAVFVVARRRSFVLSRKPVTPSDGPPREFIEEEEKEEGWETTTTTTTTAAMMIGGVEGRGASSWDSDYDASSPVSLSLSLINNRAK